LFGLINEQWHLFWSAEITDSYCRRLQVLGTWYWKKLFTCYRNKEPSNKLIIFKSNIGCPKAERGSLWLWDWDSPPLPLLNRRHKTYSPGFVQTYWTSWFRIGNWIL